MGRAKAHFHPWRQVTLAKGVSCAGLRRAPCITTPNNYSNANDDASRRYTVTSGDLVSNKQSGPHIGIGAGLGVRLADLKFDHPSPFERLCRNVVALGLIVLFYF